MEELLGNVICALRESAGDAREEVTFTDECRADTSSPRFRKPQKLEAKRHHCPTALLELLLASPPVFWVFLGSVLGQLGARYHSSLDSVSCLPASALLNGTYRI